MRSDIRAKVHERGAREEAPDGEFTLGPARIYARAPEPLHPAPGGAPRWRLGFREKARHLVPRAGNDFLEQRHFLVAFTLFGTRATRVERTTAWGVERARSLPLEKDAQPPSTRNVRWHRREKRARVRVMTPFEEIGGLGR